MQLAMSTSLFLEDLNQWYEQYEVASPKEQYEQLLELVSTTIAPTYVNKTELGDVLIEMQSLLESQGLLAEAVSLTKLVEEQQPAFYEKEFCYLGNFLIQYGLFQKDEEMIDNALKHYKQNPVHGIDSLRPVFYDLCFYDHHVRVVDLSQTIYHPVATSSKLFSGSEAEFGIMIVCDLMGQIYEQLDQEHSVDWDAFEKEAIPFGLKPDMLPLISRELSGEGEATDALMAKFKQEQDVVLHTLSMRFQMRMFDQRHLSFVCSAAIWTNVVSFLADSDRSKKPLNTPEKFFTINQKSLDRYVAQLLSSFLSDRKSEVLAVLWGLPHVYEFLHAEGVIDESGYSGAIAAVSTVKKTLLSKWPYPLWPYCFVHHWGKPAYQSEANFTAEAQQFADTAKESTPLSEEPSEPFSLEGAVDELTGAIAKNWASKPAFNLGPSSSPKSTAPSKGEGSNPPRNAKPSKVSKPRKSGLSEIKELTKKSKNKKKKKKKGF